MIIIFGLLAIALLFIGCYVGNETELLNNWYGFPCFVLWFCGIFGCVFNCMLNIV